jgi:hypothetical protein
LPALQTRQEGQKGIQPTGYLTIGADQERDVGTTWSITLSQGLLGFLTLIWNHPYRGNTGMSLQPFKTLLGGDTQSALSIVDQKTGLRRAGWVGRICFVDLVHLVRVVQPKHQTNEATQIAVVLRRRIFAASGCCCAQQPEGIIPFVRHTWTLIGLLAGLCLIGANTTQLMPPATEAVRTSWMIYLIALPIALAGLVRIGWAWTAMACVIYGTVGLAVDLATVTSILSGQSEPGTLFLFSAMSGIVNFLLILFGGRAFLHSFQGTALPVSRPPSPPSPSSSAKP